MTKRFPDLARGALAAALLAAAGLAQAADPSSVKLQVNGMVCAFCAQGIEKRLKTLDAAGPLYINLSQKVVAVEAQPGRTLDVERIRAEVREAGYEVVDAQVVPQTVAQIRDEMRARR
jgi:cation transport ATPase